LATKKVEAIRGHLLAMNDEELSEVLGIILDTEKLILVNWYTRAKLTQYFGLGKDDASWKELLRYQYKGWIMDQADTDMITAVGSIDVVSESKEEA